MQMQSRWLFTSQIRLATLHERFLGVVAAWPFSLVLMIWHLLLIGAVVLVLAFWIALALWVIVRLVRSADKDKGKTPLL
jgi:hypothetical protein